MVNSWKAAKGNAKHEWAKREGQVTRIEAKLMRNSQYLNWRQ